MRWKEEIMDKGYLEIIKDEKNKEGEMKLINYL